MQQSADEIRLVPYRRRGTRLWVLVVMIAFALICGPPWYHVAIFALSMGLLLGTFPRAWLRGEKLQREFLLLFLPIHSRECQLSRVQSIETGLEEQLGAAYGLLLGVKVFVFGKIFDRLAPWLGGDFKIWLRLASGRRLLAWQGNSQRHFRENLDVLEARIGLRAVRGPDTDVFTTAEVSELLQEVTVVRWLKAFFGGRHRPPIDHARDETGDQPPGQAK